MAVIQPLRGNALTVFDASFAHLERIGNAVQAAATPGPCGGRTRRQRANVMERKSDGPGESDVKSSKKGAASREIAVVICGIWVRELGVNRNLWKVPANPET